MERATNLVSLRILANIVPVALGILGVLVANFPVSFLGGHVAPPLLGFMPLYFWGMVRPDLMSPFWAFVLGFLEDVLSGGPPGVWAASYLAAYYMIDSQRDMLASLSGVGALTGFAVAALIACFSAYVIVCLLSATVLPLAPMLGELAITVIVYVFAVFVFGAIHRRLVGPLRSDF
jgi:rod shape-determining protein MreD